MRLPILILIFFSIAVLAGKKPTEQNGYDNSIFCVYQNDIDGVFIYDRLETHTRIYSPGGTVSTDVTTKGVCRTKHPFYSIMGMGFEIAHFPKGKSSFRIGLTYMPKQNIEFNQYRLYEINKEKISDACWKDSISSVITAEMLFFQFTQIYRIKLLSRQDKMRLCGLAGWGICPGFLIIHDSLGRKPLPSIYGFPLIGIQFFPLNRFSVSLEATYSLGVSQEQRWYGSPSNTGNISMASDFRYRYVMNGFRVSACINYYSRRFYR